MAGIYVLLVCYTLVVMVPLAAQCELIMAYSIQRHGARNVLPKSAVLTESDASGGPTLLPAGQQMCFEAGTAFHKRYIAQATCGLNRPSTCLSSRNHEQYGVINKPGVGFSNYNSYASSSALDRTIMSANSFLAGVFPKTSQGANSTVSLQVVPVYSISDSEDWRIRGYTKCPAYQTRLAAWLKSDAFRQKEQETQQLRQKVQGLAPQLNTSLAMWWDVYDAFNVWRTYGVGTPMPDMDNATFSQVVELAMWLETSKMSPELTGNLLGGSLLGDMLSRMAAAEQAGKSAGQAPYYKLLTVSSHYNTQLGVLSALQAAVQPSQRTQYLWLNKIPSLAAVLVFELHKTPAGPLIVRAVFKDGPKAQYQVVPLPCAVAGDAAEAFAGPGSCTLEAFRALAGPQAFDSSSAWCEACNNNKVMACVVLNMARQLVAVGVDPASAAMGGADAVYGSGGSGTGAVSPGMVALWCVVSVAAAAALAGAVFVAVKKVQQKRGLKHQLAQAHGVRQLDSGYSLDRTAPV